MSPPGDSLCQMLCRVQSMNPQSLNREPQRMSEPSCQFDRGNHRTCLLPQEFDRHQEHSVYTALEENQKLKFLADAGPWYALWGKRWDTFRGGAFARG